MVRFSVYSADLENRRLYKHGIEVRLQEQPFRILASLLKKPGEIVTREQLHAELWPNDTFVAFDEGLNAAVNRLRRALGDSAENPRFIETVPKQGYRFIGTLIASAPPPSAGSEPPVNSSVQTTIADPPARNRWRWRVSLGVALVVLLLSGAVFGYRTLRRNAQLANQAAAANEYQQGRALWRHRNAESLVKAIEHYDRAISLDPSYARAYASLADAYVVLPMLSTMSSAEVYPKARAAAAKAVSLDPQLGEAHISAADVKLYVDWDFASAEREFRRALELDPGNATAHQWYAEYLSLVGRHDEAIREILRAQELDPLSAVMYHQAGQIYQNARRYEDAVTQYQKALELDPNFHPASARLGDALRHQGKYREAAQAESEFFQRHGVSFYSPATEGPDRPSNELRAYLTGGEKGYWRYRLDHHSKSTLGHPGSMYHLAIDYAQNGDLDHAIECLNRVYEAHANDILSIKVDVELDPLRSDPRFQELIRKVGLP